jgi:hypothetical protein
MGSHFGLPSLPHLTSSAKQSIRLALRSVLAFVVSALLCYLPGTIPGTSPVKALENSYISLSAMIVSSSSLGETTRRGLMSSIGCAVAYGIALALLELVAAVVGTDKELNTERRLLIVSSGLIATFILTFALQLVTIEVTALPSLPRLCRFTCLVPVISECWDEHYVYTEALIGRWLLDCFVGSLTRRKSQSCSLVKR